MRTKIIELTTAVLFASAASGQAPIGQNVDRVFRFRNTQTVQGYQEIATVLRTVAGIRDFHVNIAKGTLDLHGTADQVALVGWLFNELDNPAIGLAVMRHIQPKRLYSNQHALQSWWSDGWRIASRYPVEFRADSEYAAA